MTTRAPRPRSGPLAGIRVADFCWMGVGSVATRMLADFGADVIKIENRTRLDMPRRLPIYKDDPRSYGEEVADPDPDRGGLFNNYCRNKLGVTLDMSTPEGRALCDRLISASSIVTENFAPGVMERWGLTYERMARRRPELIVARMSGYGHDGPHQGYRSYGPVIQAVCGLSSNSGLPGREPSGWGLSYMDNQAAYYNSAALLLAIFARERTGLGCAIDVSAVEVGINLLGPDLLDTLVNGRPSRRPDFPRGNRVEYPAAAPHGVYPASGHDEWIAIAVLDDQAWAALVEQMGRPAWTSDPALATTAGRVERQDDLDARLGTWTENFARHDLMHRLQAAGIPAGAVQHSRDLAEDDPQIAARGTFFELDHPVIGPALFEGQPMHLSRTDPDNWRSAPLLGEDNDHVFGDLLGLDADELAALRASGAI